MMKPIWNAVFNSLITKAGIRMRIGVSSGFLDFFDTGNVGKHRDVGFACLLEHEGTHWHGSALTGLENVDLAFRERLVGLGVHPFQGRRHDEEGQE